MSTSTVQPIVPLAGDRLRELLRLVLPCAATTAAAGADRLLISPPKLRTHLEQQLAGEVGRIRVTGTLDRRLVLIERPDSRWVVADLSGQPHDTRHWPTWTHVHSRQCSNCDQQGRR